MQFSLGSIIDQIAWIVTDERGNKTPTPSPCEEQNKGNKKEQPEIPNTEGFCEISLKVHS